MIGPGTLPLGTLRIGALATTLLPAVTLPQPLHEGQEGHGAQQGIGS
jgi:hypothetical protein